jgi:glycosyltransferase involved in cell wall biosynthesis
MTKRIKIAFLTPGDPLDRRSWSGINHYMAKALQKHCGDVYHLGPVRSRLDILGRLFNTASRLILKRRYNDTHSIFLSKEYGRIVGRRIARESFDLIFAPSASSVLAFVNTDVPVVYLSGTTFRLLNEYYPYFCNLLPTSVRQGNIIEGLAIKKASLLLYASSWAAQSAIDDYGADRAKTHVIPFGANFEEVYPREEVLKKKRTDQCRLLFLGVEWQRKGGDIAFETLLKLEELGINAHLTVCGCKPPNGLSHTRLTVIPFLDKNDDRQRRELADLLFTSDFLLLPTRSECFGIVFCEANAFGLPVITTDTGGVAGAIEHMKNGLILPLSAGGSEYAQVIRQLYQDEERYCEMVKASRAAFEERLNWDTWGIEVRRLIGEMLEGKRTKTGGRKIP